MPDRVAAVLLRCRGLVAVEQLSGENGRRRWRPVRRRDSATGTAVLEVELIHRGYLMSAGLYQRCAAMAPRRLAAFGRELLALIDAGVGAHVDHVPLFRGFPDTVPDDATELFVDRMFSVLLQLPDQPCVLCGETRTVNPVSPCGHLVCDNCWDGADYSACPICHRRIDQDDPFLRPSDPATVQPVPPPVETLRLLVGTDDLSADAAGLVSTLLSRQAPLAAQDRDDLTLLIEALLDGDEVPEWMPEVIPVRETKAVVLALLAGRYPGLLERYADTATDVLRFLYALMGGDSGLRTPPPKRRSLPRAMRREVLARLDRLPVPLLLEDMCRHRGAWQRMAENLHPYEHTKRFPVAATAFALVRRTDLSGREWQPIRETVARHPELRYDGGRLRVITFGSQVESALARGNSAEALELLRARPGELMRRLLHLARVARPAELLDAVAEVVSDASPALLVAAIGQLRTPSDGIRLFFPRGGSARAWVEPDRRDPLPRELATALVDLLTTELIRRAATLPPVGRALVDERLEELAAPGSDRSASGSLLRLPRGSTQPVPDGQLLRLFLHWLQPATTRVDLDLSVAVFDERWDFVALCDYTTLRVEEDALVHSGDLTSAPAPLGASEFVDVDTELVRLLGGRHLVPVLFSYNDVPFEQLERGFAGVMQQPNGLFDPLSVRERFDLAGPAKVLLPFGVDLWESRLRWYDVNLSTSGIGHNVDRYADQLARLASALEDVYGSGDRVSLWELCCWHAAARAGEVVVRTTTGTVVGYQRHTGEDLTAFAGRIIGRREPDLRAVEGGAELADLVAVVNGDVEPAPGAEVYALYPASLDADRVELVDAAHLLATLAPDTRARLIT